MEQWRKNLTILWGTQFLAMVGMNLGIPFLPFFIRDLGVTDENELLRWSGLVFAGPFVLSFIATPIWGNLGDRYGRKIMVVRAIFGLALSQVLIGFSQDVFQLFLFRLLQGAISGFIAASLALVSTNTPREKIGFALGFLQSATAGGMVMGPFFGGLLADLIGYREIFFVTAALCVVGGVVIALSVQELHTDHSSERRYTVLENYKHMLTNPQLRLVAAALVIGQIAVLMIEPVFALFVEGFETGTEYIATLVGVVFSIAGLFMVVSAPWWGRRNDRVGYRRNLIIALAAVGIAYAGHLVVQSIVQLGILRALLGFFRGGVLPTLYSLTSLHASPERRGGLMAIASSLTLIGNMVGPIIGGIIAAQFGIAASFICSSILLLSLSVLLGRHLAEVQPESVPPQ